MAAFRIIGAIDIRGGKAVHAKAGERERYAPVERVAGARVGTGDAVGLARAYAERLGVGELYVADLDAIRRHGSNDGVVGRIARLGPPVWLDSGIASVPEAEHALRLGARTVVVGLETLPAFEHLRDICAAVGRNHVAFSLDLRGGALLAHSGAAAPGDSPIEVARRALDAGAGTLIVIDVARVGTARGVDLDLVTAVRRVAPETGVFAGGGVRNQADLANLAAAGCDGALVATALQDGSLGAFTAENPGDPGARTDIHF